MCFVSRHPFKASELAALHSVRRDHKRRLFWRPRKRRKPRHAERIKPGAFLCAIPKMRLVNLARPSTKKVSVPSAAFGFWEAEPIPGERMGGMLQNSAVNLHSAQGCLKTASVVTNTPEPAAFDLFGQPAPPRARRVSNDRVRAGVEPSIASLIPTIDTGHRWVWPSSQIHVKR